MNVADRPPLHLGVALEGAGWHPAAWREADAAPQSLFDPHYWVDLAKRAERGFLDFLTIEDSLRVQSDHPFRADDRTDRVRGRLDAVLIAARVAPLTERIGIIPTVQVTHTEPFHISKAIATLDYVSRGRAGVRVQLSGRADEARHFGRRTFPQTDPTQPLDPDNNPSIIERFEEAADYVEVLRRLWDSWEDGAEIRDVATGRFIDREKLHYIDFSGQWFSVRGPSITPRPPQGQPLVAALGHGLAPYRLIARSADLGFVTPGDAGHAAELVEVVRHQAAEVGRPVGELRVFADLVVHLDNRASAAAARKTRLDEWAGYEWISDATAFVGTPRELADLIEEWTSAGLAGFRLRPATVPHDLDQIAVGLVPELQRRGAFRQHYQASTLRGHFGLDRPPSRYAGAGEKAS